MQRSIKHIFLITVSLLIAMTGAVYSASDIPVLRDTADPAENAKLKTRIDAARSEGKMVWEGGMIEPVHAKYISEGFKEYYGLPDVDIQYTYMTTSKMVTRVEQLIKANRPTPDIVWHGGMHTWYRSLVDRGEALKYESPYYKEYTLSQEAKLSLPGYWVSNGYTFSPMFNPKAMAKAGLPDFKMDSYWDLVNPKLKGLLSAHNFSQSMSGSMTAIGWKKVLGDKWFKEIAKLKPTLYLKTAQGREWVASGEYPISTSHHAKNATVLRKGGTPVTLVYPKEGVVMIPFSSVILADGEHPNLTKLFVDYAYSERGANRIADSGALIFYGRPGIKSRAPDVLPPWETINVIKLDHAKEVREEDIRAVQQYCLDIGWCY